MSRSDLIAAVREMIERHWDVYSIASKLRVDPVLIQQILDSLS